MGITHTWLQGNRATGMIRAGGSKGTSDADTDDTDADDTDTDDIDDEDADGEDEDDTDDDEGDDEDDDEDEDKDGFDEDAFMAKVESRIDRRINGAVNKIMKRLDAVSPKTDSKSAPKDGVMVDVRVATMAYREDVGDRVKFSSPEERAAGMAIAKGFIAQRIAAGDTDEDEIGVEAAKAVAAAIKTIRVQAEKQVRASLQRQGILPTKKGDGGTAGRRNQPGLKSEMSKGAATAALRHPSTSK